MENKKHWLDEPQNVKKVWRIFLAILALTVIAEIGVHLHPHFEVEGIFGFHAAYGFITCALMIIVAKGLGLILKRQDTYYGADNE